MKKKLIDLLDDAKMIVSVVFFCCLAAACLAIPVKLMLWILNL